MDNTTAKIIAGAIMMLGANILFATLIFVSTVLLPSSTSTFELVMNLIGMGGMLLAAINQYRLSYSFLFPPYRN